MALIENSPQYSTVVTASSNAPIWYKKRNMGIYALILKLTPPAGHDLTTKLSKISYLTNALYIFF